MIVSEIEARNGSLDLKLFSSPRCEWVQKMYDAVKDNADLYDPNTQELIRGIVRGAEGTMDKKYQTMFQPAPLQSIFMQNDLHEDNFNTPQAA